MFGGEKFDAAGACFKPALILMKIKVMPEREVLFCWFV
jgi:hypothetical protein